MGRSPSLLVHLVCGKGPGNWGMMGISASNLCQKNLGNCGIVAVGRDSLVPFVFIRKGHILFKEHGLIGHGYRVNPTAVIECTSCQSLALLLFISCSNTFLLPHVFSFLSVTVHWSLPLGKINYCPRHLVPVQRHFFPPPLGCPTTSHLDYRSLLLESLLIQPLKTSALIWCWFFSSEMLFSLPNIHLGKTVPFLTSVLFQTESQR